MASAVIRGLSEETHAVLEARACQHKRSTEAEIRQICADAVVPMLERGQSTSRRSGVAACTRGRKTAPSGLLCVIAACWKASMAEGCCACGRAASSRPCAVDDGGRVRVRPVGQRRVGGGASYVVGECR